MRTVFFVLPAVMAVALGALFYPGSYLVSSCLA